MQSFHQLTSKRGWEILKMNPHTQVTFAFFATEVSQLSFRMAVYAM